MRVTAFSRIVVDAKYHAMNNFSEGIGTAGCSAIINTKFI